LPVAGCRLPERELRAWVAVADLSILIFF